MRDSRRPLVILDRDGVINEDSPDFVKSPEEFIPLPGSIEAIMGTIAKHGGQAVAAGPPEIVMGSMEHAVVCISFPDADAAKAWLDDDDYAPLKAIRHGSTSNIREYIVPGLG